MWRDTRDAEGAYDRSTACRFTPFVAYEWTAGVDHGKNLHRNVIFRDEPMPELPESVMETGGAARVDCTDEATLGPGLEGCCEPSQREAVLERAWTSPIWYAP